MVVKCLPCISVKFTQNSLVGTSLVAQRIKRLPTMRETWIWSLGRQDPLEKEMATHSSILAWRIPWMEEPSRLQSAGSQRVRHDWVTSLTHLCKVQISGQGINRLPSIFTWTFHTYLWKIKTSKEKKNPALREGDFSLIFQAKEKGGVTITYEKTITKVRAFLKRNLPVSSLKLTPRKLAPKVALPKSSCWETAPGEDVRFLLPENTRITRFPNSAFFHSMLLLLFVWKLVWRRQLGPK